MQGCFPKHVYRGDLGCEFGQGIRAPRFFTAIDADMVGFPRITCRRVSVCATQIGQGKRLGVAHDIDGDRPGKFGMDVAVIKERVAIAERPQPGDRAVCASSEVEAELGRRMSRD